MEKKYGSSLKKKIWLELRIPAGQFQTCHQKLCELGQVSAVQQKHMVTYVTYEFLVATSKKVECIRVL